MAEGRFVSYVRVSTGKQGRSGLGLEAQRETVQQALNGGDWKLVAEFIEVESGTRKGDNRPKLDQALARCRVMAAKLIVANVSRLTRNPDFMSRLAAAGVEVWFCDLPASKGRWARSCSVRCSPWRNWKPASSESAPARLWRPQRLAA